MRTESFIISALFLGALTSCAQESTENNEAKSIKVNINKDVQRPGWDIEFKFDSEWPEDVSKDSIQGSILSALRSSIRLGQLANFFDGVITDEGFSTIRFKSFRASQIGGLKSLRNRSVKIASGKDKSYIEGTFSSELDVFTFKLEALIDVFGNEVSYTSSMPFYVHRSGKVVFTVNGKVDIQRFRA